MHSQLYSHLLLLPSMALRVWIQSALHATRIYAYVDKQTCKPAHTYTFTLCMQESKSMCAQIFKPKKHTHTSQLKALPLYMGLLYVHTREYTQYIHTHTIFCIIYIYIYTYMYKHTIYMYIHTHIHDRHCLYGPPVC